MYFARRTFAEFAGAFRPRAFWPRAFRQRLPGSRLGLALVIACTGQSGFAQAAATETPFDTADANHDGKISRAEYIAARTAMFARLDRNHDGVINREDFPNAASQRDGMGRLDAVLSVADTNGDGSVSRFELAHAPSPLFDRADANRDGFVSQAELAALRQALRQARQARGE